MSPTTVKSEHAPLPFRPFPAYRTPALPTEPRLSRPVSQDAPLPGDGFERLHDGTFSFESQLLVCSSASHTAA